MRAVLLGCLVLAGCAGPAVVAPPEPAGGLLPERGWPACPAGVEVRVDVGERTRLRPGLDRDDALEDDGIEHVFAFTNSGDAPVEVPSPFVGSAGPLYVARTGARVATGARVVSDPAGDAPPLRLPPGTTEVRSFASATFLGVEANETYALRRGHCGPVVPAYFTVAADGRARPAPQPERCCPDVVARAAVENATWGADRPSAVVLAVELANRGNASARVETPEVGTSLDATLLVAGTRDAAGSAVRGPWRAADPDDVRTLPPGGSLTVRLPVRFSTEWAEGEAYEVEATYRPRVDGAWAPWAVVGPLPVPPRP